jgi:carboxymethylenebutenolidase
MTIHCHIDTKVLIRQYHTNSIREGARMLCLEPNRRPRGGIMVVHSWWGLTPSFHSYGAKLVQAGYSVALPDLFAGRTARTEAQGRALRAAPRGQPMYRTLEAGLARLGTDAPGLPLAVVGFSMGGHWAVWLCQRREYALAATILYYAARAGDFTQSHSAIQAHLAADDPWVSPAARRGMERAIAKAHAPYIAWDYPGTGHWFAETDRPDAYDAPAAKAALARDLAFLDGSLSPPG